MSQLELPKTLPEVQPLQFEMIQAGPRSPIRTLIERYHYLGYNPLLAAQIRYLVSSTGGQPLVLLGFGVAVWQTAPRDRCIGWSPEGR